MNKTEKNYFGFVYLWYDIKNGKFIIGSHHGKVEDSYKTSTGGVHVKRIFSSRSGTMKRRILEYCYVDDFRETQKLEQKWLNLRPDIASDSRYYNLKQYATGGIDKSVRRNKPEYWIMGHKERQLKLVESGDHNFNSKNTSKWAKKRVEEGTHHFLSSDFNKKPFQLFKNGELIGEFSSKTDAVNQGLAAGVVDKLRKENKYCIIRGTYEKTCKNKLFLFKKNDILEYKEISYDNKNCP